MPDRNFDSSEREWLEHTYAGDGSPELTVRALAVGALLGALIIALNVYLGLKTGFPIGGSMVAVILGFAILQRLGGSTPLENNIVQTTASAAGSLGTIVNVIPALILLAADGVIARGPSMTDVFLWILFTGFLGVFFAVPLRRQVVVIDRLTFPTGTACAQTIRAVHADSRTAMRQARVLGVSGAAAGLIAFFRDGPWTLIPSQLLLPFKTLFGVPTAALYAGVSISPVMTGVGFLVGPRIALSMLLGAAVAWLWLIPGLIGDGTLMAIAETMAQPHLVNGCHALLAQPSLGMGDEQALLRDCKWMYLVDIGHPATYVVAVRWLMWPGLGLILTAGLAALATRWRTLLAGLRAIATSGTSSPTAHLELPTRLWLAGTLVTALGTVVVLQWRFDVAWYLGALAIPVSFLLAILAVYAVGNTEFNPTGPLGAVTQILFGALQAPLSHGVAQVVTGNLLTGGVACAGAWQAGDMMQDLKTGYLLGSTPRRQVIAQLVGVAGGSLLAAPIFWLLTADQPVGSAEWPAPAALTWSGLATMMARGADAIPPGAASGLCVGALIAIAFAVAEARLPARARSFVPSAIGMGVATILPLSYSVSIVVGALALVLLRRFARSWGDSNALPIGAGLIAGEGIMGLAVALLRFAG